MEIRGLIKDEEEGREIRGKVGYEREGRRLEGGSDMKGKVVD